MPVETCQKYTGTLSEILALTPVVQTIADATDIPGVRLEWLNGAWYGDCGFPSAAQHSALLAANAYNSLGVGSRATLPSGPVTWRGASAGWVAEDVVQTLIDAFHHDIAFPADTITTVTWQGQNAGQQLGAYGESIPFTDPRYKINAKEDFTVSYTRAGINFYRRISAENPYANASPALFLTYTGRKLDYPAFASGNPYLYVDEGTGMKAYGRMGNPATGGDIFHAVIDFGSYKTRKILILDSSSSAPDLFYEAGQTLTFLDQRNIVNIGDSFGATGSSYSCFGPFSDLANSLLQGRDGIIPVDISIGGTGYTNPGNLGGSTQTVYNRIDFAAKLNPMMWTIMMGLNDAAVLADIQAAAEASFAKIREKTPSAVIAAVASWAPDSSQMAAITIRSDAVLNAIRKQVAPWVFVRPDTGYWESSNGKTGYVSQGGFWTGNGYQVIFTAALVGATSATLKKAWARSSGTWSVAFSDGTVKSATLTAGGTSISWTGAVTASDTASVFSGTPRGNRSVCVGDDGTHPTQPTGVDQLATLTRSAILTAMRSLKQ